MMLDRRPDGVSRRGIPFWGWGLMCLLVLCSRIAIAPRYLYHFDAANFALSIQEFNPALHQPQPPGYPLFVGLLRVLHAVLPDPQQTLIAAGLVGSLLALVLIKLLGDRMFASPTGTLAVAALALHPAFWFGGVTNQVRVWMAVCSLAVAVLAWEALQTSRPLGWLVAAFAALGLLAGFRPALGLQLLPLLLYVWYRAGRRADYLAVSGLALGAAMLPWVFAACVASGGFAQWMAAMWGYANQQFHDSSLAFGAPAKDAWQMFRQAFVWNMLGVLSWLWAVPFLRRHPFRQAQAAFLLVWFLPVFLFSAFVHIGDPDQALGSIPALCVAGGVVLAGFLRDRPRVRLAPLTAAVLTLNAVLFFVPPGRLARASSYRAVHRIDQQTRNVVARIQEMRPQGPFCIEYEAIVPTWRQIAYYFPDAYLHVNGPEPFVLQQNRRIQPDHQPDCTRTVRVPPNAGPVQLQSSR